MLFDHALKINRAESHLRNLETEISSWVHKNPYAVRYEYDPHAGAFDTPGSAMSYILGNPVLLPGRTAITPTPEYGRGVLTVYVSVAAQPPPDPISLLVGEVLHNLRSGLDNLAFALANAFTKPLPEAIAKRSEFPIFGNVAAYGSGVASSGVAKVQGWDPRAQTVVEGLQPYKRGDDFASDPLWILHELDRINKHRLLPTCAVWPTGTQWTPARFSNVRQIGPGTIKQFAGPIHADTPVQQICGIHPIDPNREMNVDIRPSLVIAFGQEMTVAAGIPIAQALGECLWHIRTVVLPPLAGFLL